MFNLLWTHLYRTATNDNTEFGRKTDEESIPGEDTKPIRDTLVSSHDCITRAWQAEQCLQLILNSSLRDFALKGDPVNTYYKVKPLFPSTGLYAPYSDIRHIPPPTDSQVTEVITKYTITMDTGSGVYYIDGSSKNFNTNAELSGPFILPTQDVFYVHGPVVDGDVVVELVNYPMMAFDKALKMPKTSWVDQTLREYESHIIWSERLAARLLDDLISAGYHG